MTTKEPTQQDSNEFKITDVRIIRLNRYIYSKAYRQGIDNNNSNGSYQKFYLFDFFDCMTHIKDDNLQYEDCMGLEKTVVSENGHKSQPNNILVSQLCTLVRTNDDNINDKEDPFLYASKKEKGYLSDKPFLAVITVNIDPNDYTRFIKNSNEKTNDEEYDEKEFIEGCIDSINKRIEYAKQKGIENAKKEGIYRKNDVPLTRVFVSMNYGDFCVAVRSASMNDAYSILSELRRPSITADNNKYTIRFGTFTTMGLETGVFEDKPANIESKAKCLEDNYYISLRMSVHSSLISRFITLKNNYRSSISIAKDGDESDRTTERSNGKDISVPYGLFGRYEVSIELDLAQFNELYPLLCNHKLNMGDREKIKEIPQPPKLDLHSLKKEDCEAYYNKYILHLIDFGIRNDYIHVINERAILKDLYSDDYECEVAGSINDQDNNKTFDDAYKRLSERIDELCIKDYELPSKRKIFYESMRLVKDLFKTYTSLRYQYDSRINIWFLFALLYTLVSLIEKSLAEIKKLMNGGERDSEEAFYLCDNLIEYMNHSIKSINSFARSIQSRNLQTIYSPNYEIESQVDLEKYIIAFTEFLRILIKKYFERYKFYGKDEETNKMPRRLITLITMDFDAQKVMAIPLFENINLPLGAKEDGVPAKLIPMSIPTFECLIRAYDLLPLLCHETSHYFRFLPRDERNKFVTGMVLKRLSQTIARHWISMCNLDRNYIPVDSLEKAVWESIYEAILEYCPIKEWSVYPFNYLRDRIKNFLGRYIFRNESRFSPSISRKDTIVGSMCFLYKAGQTAYRQKGYEKTVKKYHSIIKGLDEKTKIDLPGSLVNKLKSYIEDNSKPPLREIGYRYKFSECDFLKEDLSITLCDLNLILHFIGESNSDIIMEIEESLNEFGLIIDEDSIMIPKETIKELITELSNMALVNNGRQLLEFFYKSESSPYKALDLYKNTIGTVPEELQKIMDRVETKLASIVELYFRLPEDLYGFEGGIDSAYKSIMIEIHHLINGLSKVSQDYKPTFSLELDYNSKILKDKVKSYLQVLCDIKYQYMSGMQIINVSTVGIPVCSNRIREGIIESVKENLSLALERLIGKSYWRGSNLVLTSSQIYPFISGLCSSADDMENFTENIQQCILSIGTGEINTQVEESLGYYREVTADLGMCAAVGFNALGYLKFYTRYYHRDDELKCDPLKDAHAERTMAVLSTLIASEVKEGYTYNDSINDFFGQIKEYIVKTIEETEKQMSFELPKSIIETNKNKWRLYKKELGKYSDEFVKYLESIRNMYKKATEKSYSSPEELLENSKDIDITQYRVMIERFKELCSFLTEKNREILISKYYERFDRIILMLNLLKRIINFIGGMDKDSSEHFKDIYKKIKNDEYPVFCFENKDDFIDSRKSVGEYFNKANPYEDRTNAKMSSDMLKNTLSFILKYYYKNRLAISDNPTFDANWINRLTGGYDAFR